MRKWTVALFFSMAALFLILAVSYRSADAQAGNYAEDRAQIEDLQARYMFYLDFKDVDKYVQTFTEDGVLDIGDGEIRGHDAIRKIIGGMPKADPSKEATKLYPATGRHNISNIVIKVEGNKAYGRAYWFHYGNNNPQRTATFDSYGHYEDEMVKVNGQWLFSKRRIYNEQVEKWIAKPGNPCW
jgi:3-phenylpropionate/cinnamic acid dioxygenase small subunit